ncbi:MAG: efflux RND transporter permease subunit [Pseudomonadota bacterium]
MDLGIRKHSESIVHYRVRVLVALFLVTAFFAAGLRHVELKTIFSDLLPKQHPFVQVYKDHPNFGNPLTVFMYVRHKKGDIYNAESLKLIWDLTRDIDLSPGVDHDQVLSIATEKARYAEATPYGIDSRPLMGDAPPETAEEIAAFRAAVAKSAYAKRFLISEDEDGALITATFIERLLDYGEAHKYLQRLAEQSRSDTHEVHLAGQPMLTGWVYHYEVQMLFIFFLTGLALVLALILYMRNFVGVVAPLASSLMAAIWGFGFVGWLGVPIEPLIMVVPLLLVARSFSHCVQFIERYFEILTQVPDKKKAAELALSVMAAPSILGIVTDATGLFLIGIAPIPAMERFALFCGFWAMMLVPCNVLLSPLLLTYLPTPRNAATLMGAGDTGFYARLRSALAFLATVTFGTRGRVTAVLLLIITSYAAWNVTQLAVGNPVEGSSLLKERSEYNRAVTLINAGFPGVNTLEVVFEAKTLEGNSRVAREAQTVAVQARLQSLVEKMPSPPEASLSFADYLPEANRLYAGGNPKWAPLDNDDRAVAAAASALMVGSSPKAFSHVTDFELRHSTVSFWYKDNRQETVDRALAQVAAAVEKLGTEYPNFTVRLASGTIALQQSLNDTVDIYQWYILAALNLVIFIACGFAYRSAVAGLVLLVPVNLSNLLLGIAMTQMSIGLDVNTLPIAAIGIGVGIDYGIYLLSRICEEYQQHSSIEEAIVRSVSTTGKAIFFTATIVLIGILPWYFLSELKFLADMGLLLVMVMLINMLVALIALPLLVWIVKPKFVREGSHKMCEFVELGGYESSPSQDREKTVCAA